MGKADWAAFSGITKYSKLLEHQLWDQWAAGCSAAAIPNSLRRERSPASARLLRVRIYEHELLLHQGFVVIQYHAVQVDERLRVDEDADVAILEHTIPLSRLRIKAHVVAQPRTTTALHAEPHAPLLGRDAFLGQSAAHFGQGLLGDLDAFRRALGRRLRLHGFDDGRHRLLVFRRQLCPDSAGSTKPAGTSYAGNAAVTVFEASCFFFQSPMAARIASSASTEQ